MLDNIGYQEISVDYYKHNLKYFWVLIVGLPVMCRCSWTDHPTLFKCDHFLHSFKLRMYQNVHPSHRFNDSRSLLVILWSSATFSFCCVFRVSLFCMSSVDVLLSSTFVNVTGHRLHGLLCMHLTNDQWPSCIWSFPWWYSVKTDLKTPKTVEITVWEWDLTRIDGKI